MIRQYNPQRFRYHNGRRVGTFEIGTIVYIQDRWHQFRKPICRNPWIVEAFVPRECCATRMVDGKYINTFVRGGHLVRVRSLRDGRVQYVADHYILAALDAGLEKCL